MKAMILKEIGHIDGDNPPLTLAEWSVPEPQEREIRVKVSACGVCHTDMDEIEGRTPPAVLPMILGHQIIGAVEEKGRRARRFDIGDRVGIAWIHSACGTCTFCREGRENLCAHFEATGRDAPGGYAEYTVVSEDFAYSIPPGLPDVEAAPLLCAGAVGYRSLRLTGMENKKILGFVGFGASAHLILQAARHLYPDSPLYVFARSQSERAFSRKLGATWAGDIQDDPPERVHCIIDTTPVWGPIVAALGKLERGGRLVINAIRKMDADQDRLLNLDYGRDLWMEKEIRSVANVTRKDVEDFLKIAAEAGIKPTAQTFELQAANDALVEMKQGNIRGAKVLVMD
jgi:propanol-preferring alcohol dehydrogenase